MKFVLCDITLTLSTARRRHQPILNSFIECSRAKIEKLLLIEYIRFANFSHYIVILCCQNIFNTFYFGVILQ